MTSLLETTVAGHLSQLRLTDVDMNSPRDDELWLLNLCSVWFSFERTASQMSLTTCAAAYSLDAAIFSSHLLL